eukprot:symbB.v1.2.006595.t2/scaffold393.1/size213714/8
MEGMPRFIVEVGSLHGHSAIQMASVLDKLQMTEVPILCIDPFTGDTNMWASYQQDASVGGWVKIIDGRMTVFDQFMANVQFAVNRSVSKYHILPFQATSTVGARWLAQKGYAPDLIFLDSAHELDETFLELSLYFNLLQPGGILFGDDYGWPAVKKDVERFVEQHNLAEGEENPIDLRIARAQAGATNLIWIMRKAKLHKKLREDALGAEQIRKFWSSFASLDLQSGTDRSAGQRWTSQEWTVLSQTRRRCVAATAPFPLVRQPSNDGVISGKVPFRIVDRDDGDSQDRRLLEENWMEAGREEEEALLCAASQALEEQQRKGREALQRASGAELLRKAREAAAAAKASEQWNVLLAVQRLIGRPANETAPAWKDMQQELHRRRERVMLQARTFLLIGSLLGQRNGGEVFYGWKEITNISRCFLFDGWGEDQKCHIEKRSFADAGSSGVPKVPTPKELEACCQAEARRLLAAQRLVPSEWRS